MKTVEETPSSGAREIVATLRDVMVTYDGYQSRAVSHLNLDFHRGGVVGVLGGKGAGKSTVLKLLAGRLGPTEGKVKIFGRSARSGSARAKVGYLPGKIDASHGGGFFSRLFAGKKEASSTARGAARLTQAVLGNRDLLILDDPFEGLEFAEANEAKGLVREMAARGKTIILSSDSLMDVKELCGRFVILHEGRLQAAGTLEELLMAPAAIRFLPPVLPREMVERVLGLLRKEVLGGASAAPAAQAIDSSKTSRADSEKIKEDAPRAEQLLTTLTKAGEARPAPANSKPDDPIDHEKLEELTKPKQPE